MLFRPLNITATCLSTRWVVYGQAVEFATKLCYDAPPPGSARNSRTTPTAGRNTCSLVMTRTTCNPPCYRIGLAQYLSLVIQRWTPSSGAAVGACLEAEVAQRVAEGASRVLIVSAFSLETKY